MNELIFNQTALKQPGKQGIMKPDSEGWYDVCLGALDYPNSRGETYTSDSAIAFMARDSVFRRRLEKGMLYGELGHPRRTPGQSLQEYHSRLCDIIEDNIAIVIKEVRIDPNAKDANGNRFIAFRGKVKPFGKHKQFVIDGFNDPNINIAFSIRSFVRENYVGGKVIKSFNNIITFDVVHEGGISVASKANSASLECAVINSESFTKSDIVSSLECYRGLGLESSGAYAIAKENMDSFDRFEHISPSSLTVNKPAWLSRL